MLTFRVLSNCIVLCALALPPLSIRAAEGAEDQPGHTIAVADFSGQDKEFGRFLADTLLTDLAQSDRLHLVERSEIRQALTELKLQSTGLVEPRQIQKVGRMVGADRLIVGSYLVRDNDLILNARLLDIHTGKVSPGDAANVIGKRDAMLPLVHHLAHMFHKRVTGTDFTLVTEQEEQTRSGPALAADESSRGSRLPAAQVSPTTQEAQDADGNSPGDITPGVTAVAAQIEYGRGDALVSERDLAALTRKLAGQSGAHTFSFVAEHPELPVSRIRALAALVKVLVSQPQPATYRSLPNSHLTPDAAVLPLWSRVYLASAIDHNLWPAQTPINGPAPATWSFLRSIISRLQPVPPSPELAVATHKELRRPVRHLDQPVDQTDQNSGYTGLIIDAHDMAVQRAMSVRILDEEGRVVYPDADHIPDMDYLQDNGMASYHYTGRDLSGDLPRGGHNPLIVRALRVTGDDFVVSSNTADRILAENRRSKFLWQWRVCILEDEGR